MATTADFRNGLCIEYNHDLFTIIEFQHVKPGKGPAFVRTKLKSLTTGRVLDNTFSAGVKVTEVRIERRKYQFLYKDDSGYHFMDANTFEQTYIDEKLIDSPSFLKEGEHVEILVKADTETPLICELPPFVEFDIAYTEPGIKGDTATNTYKAATTGTGIEIKVPLFINQGDRVKVDTRTGQYSERVKL